MNCTHMLRRSLRMKGGVMVEESKAARLEKGIAFSVCKGKDRKKRRFHETLSPIASNSKPHYIKSPTCLPNMLFLLYLPLLSLHLSLTINTFPLLWASSLSIFLIASYPSIHSFYSLWYLQKWFIRWYALIMHIKLLLSFIIYICLS